MKVNNTQSRWTDSLMKVWKLQVPPRGKTLTLEKRKKHDCNVSEGKEFLPYTDSTALLRFLSSESVF
jgi:hypothetical protein